VVPAAIAGLVKSGLEIAVEQAIEKALVGGARTADLAEPSHRTIGTREMAMAIESAFLAHAPTAVN